MASRKSGGKESGPASSRQQPQLSDSLLGIEKKKKRASAGGASGVGVAGDSVKARKQGRSRGKTGETTSGIRYRYEKIPPEEEMMDMDLEDYPRLFEWLTDHGVVKPISNYRTVSGRQRNRQPRSRK